MHTIFALAIGQSRNSRRRTESNNSKMFLPLCRVDVSVVARRIARAGGELLGTSVSGMTEIHRDRLRDVLLWVVVEELDGRGDGVGHLSIEESLGTPRDRHQGTDGGAAGPCGDDAGADVGVMKLVDKVKSFRREHFYS